MQVVLLAVVGLGAAQLAAAQDKEGPRLPVVGRPEYFDEDDAPIGAFGTPSVSVQPSAVQVEDPITVTIRVAATGTVTRPPKQIRLEQFPGFTDQFYIEYPDDPVFRQVAERTWEFTCTLKPRSANVAAVPSFPFVFFTPGFLPPERGYQVRRTTAVPITVRPRAEVSPSAVRGGAATPPFPDAVYQIAEADAVARHASVWSRERLLWLGGLALLAPPLLCAAWCIVWRQQHPDAAQRRRKRRSRAAQQALTALHGKNDPELLAAVVAGYLRERYELAAEEPTPAEVGTHLEQVGCPPDVAALAAGFFRDCDAIRYAHALLDADLAESARTLILRLEAEPCPSLAS